jgi:hypothetical protein
MADVKYDNSGSVAKNNRKEKDTHPDIRGKATIAGVEYWIDGWQRDGDTGKWYSLSFKRKEEKATDKPARKPLPAQFDDDVPF